MIELSQAEMDAINIIAMQAQSLQAKLNQATGAQQALIALLEKKYKAVFDPASGQFRKKCLTHTDTQ